MSNVPPFEPSQNPYNTPEPVAGKGLAAGTKILIVLGVVFAGLVVLCCGGVVVSGFMMRAYMARALTEDPAEIERRRAEMLQVEIPETFAPKASVDMTVPFTDKKMMTMAIYTDPSDRNSIVLVSIGEMLQGVSKEELNRKLDESLRQQGVRQGDGAGTWETREKEFASGGTTARFTYRVRVEDGTPRRFEVTGQVAGNRGPVVIVVTADAEVLTEEQIDRLIESTGAVLEGDSPPAESQEGAPRSAPGATAEAVPEEPAQEAAPAP